MKLKKKNAIAGALSAVAIVCLYFLWRTPSQYSQHLDSRQDGMALLGKFISDNRPAQKVLVFSNPFVLKPGASDKIRDFDENGYNGLRSGLEKTTDLKQVYPQISKKYEENPASIYIPPSSKTPLSFVVEASSLDALAEQHTDYPVIVSLIGLPNGIHKLKIWEDDHPAVFAFLEPDFRVLGKKSDVIAQFERGKILAALTTDKQTGAPLIVTKTNITQVLKTQPKSLGL